MSGSGRRGLAVSKISFNFQTIEKSLYWINGIKDIVVLILIAFMCNVNKKSISLSFEIETSRMKNKHRVDAIWIILDYFLVLYEKSRI